MPPIGMSCGRWIGVTALRGFSQVGCRDSPAWLSVHCPAKSDNHIGLSLHRSTSQRTTITKETTMKMNISLILLLALLLTASTLTAQEDTATDEILFDDFNYTAYDDPLL